MGCTVGETDLLFPASNFLLPTYFKMSSLVTLPSFPEPEMLSNSAIETPSAVAIFFTNGEKNLVESEN